jgi:hypothetical protein
MFDGYKVSDRRATRIKPLWLAALLLALAGGAVWWLLSLAPPPAVGF